MTRRKRHPFLFYPASLLISTGLALLFLGWVFVDLRTAFRPADPYFTVAWAVTGGLALGIYLVVGHVDFGFCRSLCPSGAYFTLLSRSWVLDLKFENPELCIACNACIRACPTDLDPRDREAPIEGLKSSWDIYPEDYRHTESRCFLCGDCIEACDEIFEGLRRTGKSETRVGLLRFRRKHKEDDTPASARERSRRMSEAS